MSPYRKSVNRTYIKVVFVATSSERAAGKEQERRGREAARQGPPWTFSPEDAAGGSCGRSQQKVDFKVGSGFLQDGRPRASDRRGVYRIPGSGVRPSAILKPQLTHAETRLVK